MAGSHEGGIAAAARVRQTYGEDFHRKIGAIGGRISKTGGFASQFRGADGLTGPERAKIAGAKGANKRWSRQLSIFKYG